MTLRFIVVADSHIRFPDDDVATYPSNALMLDRNRRVVEMCNELGAEFVVHLGDIVHPLPVEEAHEPAVRRAADVYEQMDVPIYFVPGNHDIGDKPNAMVAVPPVAESNYAVYEHYWGSAYHSFDRGDCHFVIVDTPVLNSGLDREDQQKTWLEADLAAAAAGERRVFLFTHYPPFVREAGEGEHYDNLGEPARSWLLDLVVEHGVEAVFSGHVHNFLYNHHRGTELYVLPSTGFVRPDYAELAALAPEGEGGRNDPPKLGFFVVEADDAGHVVRPVRTYGATDLGASLPKMARAAVAPEWECPIGVTLRHGWMSVVDFPTAGLDQFRRKRVRNDAMLPALWEARIRAVRIPIEDLATPNGKARVAALAGRGMRFTVRSVGVPDDVTREAIAAAEPWIDRWEIVAWPGDFGEVVGSIGPSSLRTALAPLVPIGEVGGVHHFVAAGFDPFDTSAVEAAAKGDKHRVIDEFVFRIPDGSEMSDALAGAVALSGRLDRAAVADVALPRGGESIVFDDDEAVAGRVADIARAALTHRQVAVFLDGFMDHDRSYYPHHGLVDRRYNPRPALLRLIDVSRESGRGSRESWNA